MMQSDLWKKVEAYIKEYRRKRYTFLVLSVLSILMAGSVYAVLCMPAISMTKDQPRMEAEVIRAVYGDEISFRIEAEAPRGDKPAVFVLHTESNGAGISDTYDFQDEEEDAVCLIDTEQGTTVELHREFKGDGIVNYWFSLEPEETVSFLLYGNSDMYTNLAAAEEEKADAAKAEKKQEVLEPSKSVTGGAAGTGHSGAETDAAEETEETRREETSGQESKETAADNESEGSGNTSETDNTSGAGGSEESKGSEDNGNNQDNAGSGALGGGEGSESGSEGSGTGSEGSENGLEGSGSGSEGSGSGSEGSDSGSEGSGSSSGDSGSVIAKGNSKAEISNRFTVHLFLPAYALDNAGGVSDETHAEIVEETLPASNETEISEETTAAGNGGTDDTVKESATSSGEMTEESKETVAAGTETTAPSEPSDAYEEESNKESTSAGDETESSGAQDKGESEAEETKAPVKATPSEVSVATSSNADEDYQYFRIYGGAGKNYRAGLRAAKSKDNSLELIWRETIEELTLEAITENGVTVAMTGPKDLFPEGDLRLVVKEVSEVQVQAATPSDAEEMLNEISAEDTLQDEAADKSEWLFDICIMDGDKEIEPKGPVLVTFDGIIDDSGRATATIYHIDEENDTVDDMKAWTDEEGKVAMHTDHFSLYKVRVAASGEQMTVDELLEGFGVTNQFAVFANEMDAQGHMEGSIAVKELTLISGSEFDFGNSESVGINIPGTDGELTLTVTKEVAGEGPESDIYHFGIYDENGNQIEKLEITGSGSGEITLEPGYYKVYELDADGNRISNGEGNGFTVTYDAQNLNGLLGGGSAGYVNNASYIENFMDSTVTGMKTQSVSALYVGGHNSINTDEKTITTPSGYKVTAMNAGNGVLRKPTNMDWEGNFERLAGLSETLARCKSDYDKADISTPGVSFLNIKVPSDGVVTKQVVAEAIHETDANLNGGIPMGEGQYLIVNLNCADVASGTVILPDVGPNSNNAGGWKNEYGRMVWNLTAEGSCYTGYVKMSNAAAGVILAPRGTVEQNATFGGSILADKVIRSSNEIHQHSFRFKDKAATTITNTYTGYTGQSLEIIKEDKTGKVLPGTAFALYKADDSWNQEEKPVSESVADENGRVRFEGMQIGNYLLYETMAADGYIAPVSPWKLQVTKDGVIFLDNPSDVRIESSADAPQNPEISRCRIVNQEKIGTVTVNIEKQWAGDVDGAERPGTVTVHLLGNDEVKETIELKADNGWKHTWTGLPQMDENDMPITYRVKEDAVDGYKTSITQVQEDGEKSRWTLADHFTSGKTYMLVSNKGALALQSTTSSSLTMKAVDLESGTMPSDSVQWLARQNGNGFWLTNADQGGKARSLGLQYSNGYKIRAVTNGESAYTWTFYYDNGYIYTYYNYYYYLTNSGGTTTSYDRGQFSLYELQDKKDITYNFTITNTKEAEITPNPEFTLKHHKTIDAFRDGQDNPDTALDNHPIDQTDLYRLYLDIQGDQYNTPVDLLLVIDNSGSMVQPDKKIDKQTRLEVLNDVLAGNNGFIDRFLGANTENRIATVYFSGPETKIYDGSYSNYKAKKDLKVFPDKVPTTYRNVYFDGYNTIEDYTYYGDAWLGCDWSSDRSHIKNSLITKSLNGYITTSSDYSQAGTNYAAGLQKAVALLNESDTSHLRHIIFLSDGVPTMYLKKDMTDASASLMGSIRGGTGYYAQANACVTPTKTAINEFKELCDFPISTIGFGANGDNTDTRKDLLELLVNQGGNYYNANNAGELRQALEDMSFHDVTHVSITDNISRYVKWYGDQPDVLVTMENSAGERIKLWQGTGLGNKGNIGSALPGNITVQDGSEIQIIQSVEYTPVEGNPDTTGTVTVTFNPQYKLETDYTYTLSFNVKTTENAYKEYASNLGDGKDGYGNVKGDLDTDFGADGWLNDTSSDKPGFHSNHSADVNYVLDKTSYKEPYEHPVIQVAACGLKIEKADVANVQKLLPGAGFDLYRKAEIGEEGAIPVPGSPDGMNLTGIKINAETLMTDENGIITIPNLIPAAYYLVETKAPTGYQLLEKPIEFNLKANGVDVVGNGPDQGMVQAGVSGEDQLPVLVIKNTNGFEMPHTGGPGASLYIGAGILMMTVSAAYYVKKRSSERRRG